MEKNFALHNSVPRMCRVSGIFLSRPAYVHPLIIYYSSSSIRPLLISFHISTSTPFQDSLLGL